MSITFREDHKLVIENLVSDIPGVKVGKAFGYPAFKVNGKMFAFVGGDGIGIKLPAERVQALIDSNAAFTPFEPVEGTIWREWVSITRNISEDYRQDADLLEEALLFVAG